MLPQANLPRITRVLSILLDPFLPFGQNKIHKPLVPAFGSSLTPRSPMPLVISRTVSNSPGIIGLTVVPASFTNCGASLLQVTVVATCQVSASQCKGSFNGLVQVRQPTNYRNLPANLPVNITVG